MDNKSINILLVDDEQDYSETMGFWLMSRGHSVKNVFRGKEALALLDKEVPDIVLLDINMPEMNGIETLRQIRKLNKDVPVIMVTAYGNEEQLKEAKDLGASGFFNKSDDFTEAAKLIKEVLAEIK